MNTIALLVIIYIILLLLKSKRVVEGPGEVLTPESVLRDAAPLSCDYCSVPEGTYRGVAERLGMCQVKSWWSPQRTKQVVTRRLLCTSCQGLDFIEVDNGLEETGG